MPKYSLAAIKTNKVIVLEASGPAACAACVGASVASEGVYAMLQMAFWFLLADLVKKAL